MTRSQKFFRLVWRIDVLLVFVAAAAITLGAGVILVQEVGHRLTRTNGSHGKVQVAANDEDPRLVLGDSSVVKGTQVMRANLVLRRESEGFSSGGGTETRNILFIEPGQKTGRWLLPDNKHVIAETEEIGGGTCGSDQPSVATAILVKEPSEDLGLAPGRLLLFNPTGKNVIDVADGVTKIHVAEVSGGEIAMLFERDGYLFRAAFDSALLTKRTVLKVEVPELK